MPRVKENYKLQKVTLNLRKGDWNKLRNLHRGGASKHIRDLIINDVDSYIKRRKPSRFDFSAEDFEDE